MPDPRQLLICLLDYIKKQTKEINAKGYRLTSTKAFIRQRNDIVGLPGVEFDIRVQGDHVWLRVPRSLRLIPPRTIKRYFVLALTQTAHYRFSTRLLSLGR